MSEATGLQWKWTKLQWAAAYDIAPSSYVLVGWRCWRPRLYQDGIKTGRVCWRLGAYLNRGPVWPVGEPLMALCPAGPRAEDGCDPSPGVRCVCGIHALRNPPGDWPMPIWGRVAMWGKIIEHELGFRSEFAYPLDIRIALRTGRGSAVDSLCRQYLAEIVRDLAAYGVPVAEVRQSSLTSEPEASYSLHGTQ